MEKKKQRQKREVENLTNTTSGNRASQNSKLTNKLGNKLRPNKMIESIEKQDVDTMFKNLVPNKFGNHSESNKEYVKERLRDTLFNHPEAK